MQHPYLANDITRQALVPIARRLNAELSRLGLVGTAVRESGHDEIICHLPLLDRLKTCFDLSAFEVDVMLLALSVEIDEQYALAVNTLVGEAAKGYPSVGLALRLLAVDSVGPRYDLALSSLSQEGVLYRDGLLDFVGEGAHSTRRLRIPAEFWPRLLGEKPPSDLNLIEVEGLDSIVCHQLTRHRADQAVSWAREIPREKLFFGIQGGGDEKELACAIAGELGYSALTIQIDTMPVVEARTLTREAKWNHAFIVVLGASTVEQLSGLANLVPAPIIALTSPQLLAHAAQGTSRPGFFIAGENLDLEDRCRLWRNVLDKHTLHYIDAKPLASRFRYNHTQVEAATNLALAAVSQIAEKPVELNDIFTGAREVGRSGITKGANRLVQCLYQWEDLIVPVMTRNDLRLLSAMDRHLISIVNNGATSPDVGKPRIIGGGGVVALFAGPSGTGKTMSAQLLAKELSIDLLHVDLSQVVSKYIGETEKQLDQLFDAAMASGAMLFFDEADALFGKRSEVKDAHDRYANIETSFLLQRLEKHNGLVILASNLRQNLDTAFLRRIHLIIDFPIPGFDERQKIWRRHLGAEEGVGEVDFLRLARFELSGGDIRNAACTALVLAADENRGYTMRDLAIGLWRELKKAGRLSGSEEFGDWQRFITEYCKE